MEPLATLSRSAPIPGRSNQAGTEPLDQMETVRSTGRAKLPLSPILGPLPLSVFDPWLYRSLGATYPRRLMLAVSHGKPPELRIGADHLPRDAASLGPIIPTPPKHVVPYQRRPIRQPL